MSFAIDSNDEESEEPAMSEEGISEIDSLLTTIKMIDGVSEASMDVSDNGFNLGMNFKNIEALNKINESSKDNKAVARFENDQGRLRFNLSDFPGAEGNNTEDDQMQKFFKHRVVITFDKKIRGLKTKGFKKLDKKTLVYDSEKMDEKEVSFSIKYKK